MREFHIYICDALNKHQEKLDISDKEALDAYRMFYKTFKKMNNSISYQNTFLDYLTLLDNKESIKPINYYEYQNTIDECSSYQSWEINQNPQFNLLWYMNKETKDNLIKCAEYDKEIKQKQLDFLTSNDYPISPSKKMVNTLTDQINACYKLIKNLNYYYDRKMLLFTIC